MKITIQNTEIEKDEIAKYGIEKGTGINTKVTIILKNGNEYIFKAISEESQQKLEEEYGHI